MVIPENNIDLSISSQSLIEAFPHLIFLLDVHGGIVHANATAALLTGTPAQELVGKDFCSCFSEAEAIREWLQAAYEGGSLCGCLHNIRQSDGRQVPLWFNGTVLKDENGNFVYLLIVANPCIHAYLIEAAMDLLVIVDSQGMITSVNEAAVRAAGLSRSQIIGTDFSNYFMEPERARASFREVLEKGSIRQHPFAIRHADGSPTHVLINASLFRQINGSIGVFAAGHDVTEQLALDLKFSRQRRCLEARNTILESVLYCDTEEALGKTCLSAAEWLTGSKCGYIGLYANGVNEVLAISSSDWDALRAQLSAGIDRSIYLEGSPRIINGTEEIKSYLDDFTPPTGLPELNSLLAVPLRQRGKVEGLIVLANKESGYSIADQEDIESLAATILEILNRTRAEKNVRELNRQLEFLIKQLQESWDEAQKAVNSKAQFLATMSHEIRTPLHGMLGMAQVLAATSLDKPQRHYLNTIIDAGKALQSILNNILTLSRIEAGKITLEAVDFSPARLISAVSDLFVPDATEKGLSLRVVADDLLPDTIRGDEARLREVLFNLISNAVKFSARGEIIIRAKLEADNRSDVFVHFSVSDQGVGMSEEQTKIVFEPFTQADSSVRRRHGGSGLGLYICAQLVSLLGGKINCSSIPGRGSAFEFTIPLQRTPAASRNSQVSNASHQHKDSPVQVRSERILVVEDHAINREVALLLLRDLGFEAHVVGSGQEALEALGRIPYDLVFMDVELPDIDGMSITAMLRANENKTGDRHMPVVAMTANAMEGSREACLASGMDDYISKPIDTEVLARIMEDWLPESRS